MVKRTLIVGNWKMNGRRADLPLAQAVAARAPGLCAERSLELVICPPATLLALLGADLGAGGVGLGAQDCHWAPEGAFTGDVSAAMLADLGVGYVILGHSERRAWCHETDAMVRAKAAAALAAGLRPIICVGENARGEAFDQRVSPISTQAFESLPEEKGEIVIAYEPNWAIGTGLVPGAAEIEDVVAIIRRAAAERRGREPDLRVLYGGSVRPDNAAAILEIPGVDGVLVGGASLRAADFLAIAAAARAPAA